LIESLFLMAGIIFRFYGDLNDFLPPARRQVAFAYETNGPQSVKHLIEALGVPHPEVALILNGNVPVGFSHQPQPGERIAVFPEFFSLDLAGVLPLRPPLPDPPAFLADNHLGRLVRLLRLLGIDTTYDHELDDESLAERSRDENRVLLTRDRGLLKRSLVIWGYCLRTTDSHEQLRAVLHRFRLFDHVAPWTRCLRCNGSLHPVDKAAVLDRLEPKTKLYYEEFRQCDRCGQVYWQGSHIENLLRIVEEIKKS